MISLTTRWPELRCSTTNPSRRSIDTDKHDVGTDRDELRLCPRRLNSDLSVRLHPPARVHRDGDGPSRWLPAAVLGKTANRRPTRPWAERVIIFINLRLPQLGDPVLNKSNSSPTSSRSSSELDQLSSSRQAHNRGKKISCLRNLVSQSLVLGRAVSTQTTRVPALARSRRDPSASIRAERDASERSRRRHLMLASCCSSTVLPPLRRM